MTAFILKIYDYMKMHRMTCFFSFIALSLLLVLSVSRLNYKEDIADFLPIDRDHHNALKVYQDISGANKIFAVFQCRDTIHTNPDAIVSCIDLFVEELEEADTAHIISNVTSQVDLEKMTEVTDFVYNNIPYFLSDKDYAKIDSMLALPNYVGNQLRQDKQMLMFPAGSLLSDNIRRDPLNIFTPIVQKLQHSDTGLKYEMYDGHIFSSDMQKAIVMMDSPYGASETENNSRLIAMLKTCADKATVHQGNIDIHIIGGPVIAVTNATQIKSDSILSVTISVTLILALLLFSFRNFRNLLLIALSIAWGWLFAIGGLALFHDKVSVIIIGISSVILGIAVNYPLHFIAHLSHTSNKRKALREIVTPLLVGNITTVAAFLALVPLQSIALRDLGLFSSFLLVGTILFVLVYLPHLAKKTKEVKHTFLDKLSNVSLENKPAFVGAIIILTLVFGYFSFHTRFDTNMGHINYMTDEQKADMAYFQRAMTPSGEYQKVYAISSDATMAGALDKSLRLQPYLDELVQRQDIHDYSSCNQFITSKTEQQRRLRLWQNFVSRHKEKLKAALQTDMKADGFAEDSFDDFYNLLDKDYQPQEISYFSPLVRSVFSANLSSDSINRRYNVINVLSVKDKDVQKVEDGLEAQHCYSFDVASMNSTIANHLSNDFNYIGFACGFVVFFFLWISMGSIELAVLSFIPMAVSWVWILGIMALFGMQFNIVNIILATFIFGQGDDYTIFMTEGVMYEYAYRRKMLASYKHAIIISALIMFIGIGSLIVARHPALHSLAEVTIAGMFSVVLMAYVFPPLIFKFLVQKQGEYRKRPITLHKFSVMALAFVVFMLQLASVYLVGSILLEILPFTEKRWLWFRRYQQRLFLFDLNHIPHVKLQIQHIDDTTFESPSVIISNHQSLLDSALFMALSPKTILVSNQIVSKNLLIRQIFKWNRFITLSSTDTLLNEHIQRYKEQGYSIVIFPEGKRNDASSICRFHKGAFYLAEELQLDILPVMIHGFNHILPRNSIQLFPGTITVMAYERISKDNALWQMSYSERTRKIHSFYKEEYARFARKTENAAYFHDLVLDRYRYKGTEIYHSVSKTLKHFNDYTKWIDGVKPVPNVIVLNDGYGEFALLYALVHKDVNIIVYEPDNEKNTLLYYCSKDVTPNLSVTDHIDLKDINAETFLIFTFNGKDNILTGYEKLNIVSIA